MNIDFTQLKRLIDKVFESDQILVLDKPELELLKKLLFTQTKEFQWGYVGSANVVDEIRFMIENKMHYFQ